MAAPIFAATSVTLEDGLVDGTGSPPIGGESAAATLAASRIAGRQTPSRDSNALLAFGGGARKGAGQDLSDAAKIGARSGSPEAPQFPLGATRCDVEAL